MSRWPLLAITLIERFRNRRSIAAMLAARCSFVPRKRRSFALIELPPEIKH
jgi:hypothetical protein